jgi:competence protein ComEC
MRQLTLFAALIALAASAGARDFEIYVVDVEGGKAVLAVAPSGESMLIDAGWPPRYEERGKTVEFGDRDADRIARVVRMAGLKRLDYVLVTHYDTDHVRNVPRAVEKIGLPVGAYVDHGPTAFRSAEAIRTLEPYLALRDKARHLAVKPGDRIPMKGLDVLVVASAGQGLKPPAGSAPNQACEGVAKPPLWIARGDENDAGVGVLFTFGRFRMLDLGDLLRGMEHELMCPVNPIGRVDVFMVSTHGMDLSNTPVLVHALRPRVAVMNNGAAKGGAPAVWKTLASSPGIEDTWQLHYSEPGGKDANPPERFIANPNPEAGCAGWWLRIAARRDSSFEIRNPRNGFRKAYKPRKGLLP